MIRSKGFITKKYGTEFWKEFKALSKEHLLSVLPHTPDIGNSLFSFNYKFGPPYIAWYKTFLELGLDQEECIQNIWEMNEKLVTSIPKPFLHASGIAYMSGFQKKAAAHIKRQENGSLHPYDWKINYRDIDKNSFEIDITECAMKKLAQDFKADGLLPGICRMDYLFSSFMGNGFYRTKTLGDGDDCCNCHYELKGKCEWAPDKGFESRK